MRIIQIFNFLIVFLVGFLCSTTSEKKIESEWSDLERVGAISCHMWPIKDTELDISHIVSTSHANGGMAATVRMRDGSSTPTFVETNGTSKINSDDIKTFPIGRNAVVAGVGEWKKQPIAFVVQNKNDRGWVEVRGISDNRMISRMSTPLSDDVTFGKVVPSAKGWWLQLNHGETDVSFVHVIPDVSPNWKFVLSSFQAKTRFANLVSSKANEFAYVVEQEAAASQEQGKFNVTQVLANGKSTQAGTVALPTSGGLESWSAVAVNNRILVALVRGDSMIGQGVVVVAAMSVGSSGANVEWKKEFPYPDVHLGEPVWLANDQQSLLGMIKWIDAEGSLSRIKVDANTAEMLTDVGVFPKGTVLATGYINAGATGVGAFRFRENVLWKYKLCRLSL